MESAAGTIAALPDHADIRSRVARGRALVLRLDETVSISAATAAARSLRGALPSDVTVFASPGGRGPVLTVLQLVSDSEAATVRPALEDLVAEFRQAADALVGYMNAGSAPVDGIDENWPESVRYREATWYLDPHGEHCRFENAVSGEVVEANIYAPDLVDPYFLLEYAKTSARHEAVVNVCVEGFHDMCRLLDRSGIAYG
ncbi:hypothetical protein Aca07nite_38980 [Actinoplanes capillaceus]|uniref:Uncharacterized protein n=1 Tax=Actinoplanes campanulatus TaxID=113559 RepID=A0ABQ3WK52_9ACTN|nr:hypothetical protein [Actinoplanes capillaceus]GID46623.1 hypothetical protein Aca07nite_38980 [Actinoplanes capillaceus]